MEAVVHNASRIPRSAVAWGAALSFPPATRSVLAAVRDYAQVSLVARDLLCIARPTGKLPKKRHAQYVALAAAAAHDLAALDSSGARLAAVVDALKAEPEPTHAWRRFLVRLDRALAAAPESPAPLTHRPTRAQAIAAAALATDTAAAVRTYYQRSEVVRAYVLDRARGRCELCQAAAPFLTPDGLPFLETHHTIRVSDGGPDHPRWVAALCPNCHREVHHGLRGADKNASLMDRLGRLEAAEAA